MLFAATKVHGAFTIDMERRTDGRGFFARTWCKHEYQAHHLVAHVAQINVSHNQAQGTLRGMHFQAAPFQEAKTISCTSGAIWDVVVDLRPDSPTYLRWDAAELTAENRRMLYVPVGCAHGFQTLVDETDVLYFMSECYSPEHGRGVRYNDPAFGIAWPLPPVRMTDADLSWPGFKTRAMHTLRVVQP